ncbi:MAG: pilus assembly protein PilP [Ghiorsea sp.]|nr:pilus assembly protein PilP [Ghiorsea sp.]
MRRPYLFIPLLSLMFLLSPITIHAAIEEPTDQKSEAMPDAMSHLMVAPNIDIQNIRDPFLSSFDKNRIEEAKRLKNRRQLPENKRKREVLEFFDLSTLKLVATFKKSGRDWVASVQDTTGKAYTVRRGNYIGKRGGRIEKIDGQTVYLVEQTINPAGDIVDRQVTLTLAEVNDVR